MALENNAGVVIYQGEDKDITVRLAEQSSGDPVSLSNASELAAYFKKSDETVLVKKMTLSQVVINNAGGGIFTIKVTAADSLLLATGENQSIEIRITASGYLNIAQIQNAITVLPSLFPGV